MSRTPLALLIALALTPACLPAPPDPPAPPTGSHALARVAAAPGDMGGIESVDYVGTGCEEGTTASAISEDRQVITSTFSAFVAAADPLTDPEAATRNCIIILHVDVPAGWSYSLESVDHRGFVGLERTVTASRKSVYVVSGSPVQDAPTARFRGPTTRDYAHHDIGPDRPGEWSPCGGGQLLWVATQIEASNQEDEDRAGQITIDSIDTELQWRRCE